ncbi:hypothetical protein BB558_005639, partial [Smittium angustum]
SDITYNNSFLPLLIQTRNSLVGKLLGGEYQVPVSKLLVSNDMMPINMLLDTASYLAGIVTTQASIIDDSIAQHVLLNQRPVMDRVPLVRRSGVGRFVLGAPVQKYNSDNENTKIQNLYTNFDNVGINNNMSGMVILSSMGQPPAAFIRYDYSTNKECSNNIIVDEVENKHLDSYLSNISLSNTNLGIVQDDPRHINGLQPGVPTSTLIAFSTQFKNFYIYFPKHCGSI